MPLNYVKTPPFRDVIKKRSRWIPAFAGMTTKKTPSFRDVIKKRSCWIPAFEGVAKGPIFRIPASAPLMERGHNFSSDPLAPHN
jgi:hypothetical protein